MIRQNLVWIVVCSIASLLCYKVVGRNPQGHYCAEIFHHIEKSYLEKKSPHEMQEIFDRAAEFMVKELDEYSDYIPAEKSTDFRNDINSKVDGIGIFTFTDSKKEHLFVQMPVLGSPAEKAGLKGGDKIVEVGNQSVKKIGTEKIVKVIRGEPGTSVNVKVQRYDSPEILSFDIVREHLDTHSVIGYARDEKRAWKYHVTEEPRIAYMRINQFSQESDEEVKQIFSSDLKKTPAALILDLRGNPGGPLPAAKDIADLFLKSGKIVSVESPQHPELDENFVAKEEGTLPDFPIVVLIDRHSASAAELLAAALQDNHRATIIGERSYGKGTVQHLIPLTPKFENGHSNSPILKLTVAQYIRPNGKNIHRGYVPKTEKDISDELRAKVDEKAIWGVTPDAGFAKKLTDEEWTAQKRFLSERESGQLLSREEILKNWKIEEPKDPTKEQPAKKLGQLMDDDSPDQHLKQAIEFLQKKIDK
jgi:carboxyl-terminal processing protease